ncbi:hypothetical protein QFZ79_003360 [Arthrobacter sp. V4I6]|uniref:hypothetical protein n=1 Tax=unclassified Arthrobacter TaxID=235627 RepID=UPI00277E1C4D|nr:MULTISPECIES: hypothetical protein [unclassified Arthrobacter]MDQ0820988.1 hypothetical protein [Arthrobacter sp. V1I7]MDQ0855249.1 hypothetical protein [Arthrobacter sp. V4I6]
MVDAAEPMIRRFSAGDNPYPVEMATEHVLRPGYDFGDESEMGSMSSKHAHDESPTAWTRPRFLAAIMAVW